MVDPLEDLFKDDERKKETVKLFQAQCPGYVWHGKVHDVTIVHPHLYQTPIKPEDRGKDYVCESCAEHYASDDRLKKSRGEL